MGPDGLHARAFGRYALAVTGLTYALIVLGGFVRTSGAGDACPDWPLCHGRLLPPPEPLVLVEYAHRLVAAFVGVLVIGAVIWTHRRSELRRVRRWAWAALVLVGIQGLLGGLTVLSGLATWSVVMHLATSLLVLAALVVLTLRVVAQPASASPLTLLTARSALGALYGLVLLGGYIGASNARIACPDWPLCRGQVLPPLEPGVLPHLLHRAAALVVLVLLGVLVVRVRRERPELGGAVHLAAAAYGLEIVVGAGNKLLRLPPAVVTAHLGLAALIWALLVGVLAVLSGGSRKDP